MAQQWRPAQLVTGTPVYDATGAKLGKLVQYDEQGGYLLVEKGLIFVKDIYAPVSAVTSVDESGIQLSLSKDDLSNERYTNPPLTTTATDGGWPANTTSSVDGGWPGTTATDGTTTSVDNGWPANASSANTTTGVDRGWSTNAATSDQVVDDTDQLGVTDQDIPVREEELVAGKQRREEGRVHIHKDVEEVPETVDVTLRKERVTVERVPFTGDPNALDDAFKETDIDVPVMGEEPVVGKRVRGVEDVRVHKDVVDETEQVSDTVRKERVVVDGADDEIGRSRR